MEPLPNKNCAFCEIKVATWSCVRPWPTWIRLGVRPKSIDLNTDITPVYPGQRGYSQYVAFQHCITTAAYAKIQQDGKVSKAKALKMFWNVAKAPIRVNRRILNRIIPALQIQFGLDEMSWQSVYDSEDRYRELLLVRKRTVSLAPRWVCPEDEWFHLNDPGLMAIRILLQIKSIWMLNDTRNACILADKLPAELEFEVQKIILQAPSGNQLLGISSDLGSFWRLTERICHLRQRIRKNIRRIHDRFPYFLPSFLSTRNTMLHYRASWLLDDVDPGVLWEHRCGWIHSCCRDEYGLNLHHTQVAYNDIYPAYAATTNAIEWLCNFFESCVPRCEIDPYVQELDEWELEKGELVYEALADNINVLNPLNQRL